MSIYRQNDYKLVLKDCLKKFKQQRGVITKLAQAAGCQRSYLSQVLNTHVQLTPDQALGVCQFFGFNDDETTYFLTLLDYARAATPALKKRLTQTLEAIRKKNDDLEGRFSTQVIQASEQDFIYYSSWMWSAIHIAVSIPHLQNPQALATHLQLPLELVLAVLDGLKKMGLVENKGSKWTYLSSERHLSKRSTLVSMKHSNWRQRAILSSQTQVESAYHYTGISSVSHYDYQQIKDMLLKMTEEIRKIISLSKEEELVCLNLDFFKS